MQDHGGRRTFVSTNGGYRLEVHPPRDWLDELLRGRDRLPARRAPSARRRPGREGERSRRDARPPAGGQRGDGRRRAHPLPPGRAGGPARARRRALRLTERGRRLTAQVEGQTYAAAGVSLATADAVVERLRRPSSPPGAKGFGAFAGLYPLDERRLLAASTDGVGTKLILARERGRAARLRRRPRRALHQRRADDRRRPAVPARLRRREPDRARAGRRARRGAAEVCRAAGCALLGGETAELPGIYRDGELDFAGTCVGIVDRDALIDGSRGRGRRRWSSASRPRASTRTASRSSAGCSSSEDYDGDDLLAPTRLYLDDVRAPARARARASPTSPAAGSTATSRRVLPDGLDARDRLGRLGAPAGLRLARPARRGGGAAPRLQPRHRLLRGRRRGTGEPVIGRIVAVIGVLVSGEGTNLQALLDAGLPVAAVASNRPDAPALARAAAAGVPRPSSRSTSYATARRATRRWPTGSRSTASSSSCCAGYMHLLRPSFLDRFPDRVVNVHPALAAGLPGRARRSRTSLAAGVPETGATVHFVDEGVDTGPVIAAGARRRCSEATRPRRCARASRRSSTACCPRSSAS